VLSLSRLTMLPNCVLLSLTSFPMPTVIYQGQPNPFQSTCGRSVCASSSYEWTASSAANSHLSTSSPCPAALPSAHHFALLHRVSPWYIRCHYLTCPAHTAIRCTVTGRMRVVARMTILDDRQDRLECLCRMMVQRAGKEWEWPKRTKDWWSGGDG
jgi:hypothetical protein